MASKAEQVLQALCARLAALSTVLVQRNTGVPVTVPGGGLIIVRDGDPGEPDQVLGGFAGAYYAHQVPVEIYVQDADQARRDAAWDALVLAIGAALAADPTLGGAAFGLLYGRPEVDTEGIPGAPAIKAGTLTLTIEYESSTPLG